MRRSMTTIAARRGYRAGAAFYARIVRGPRRAGRRAFRYDCALFLSPVPMAQYVYTMQRVGKVVPPKRQILKNISLSFFPGAKIGVLGLNGSGKSTLLKIMAGLDKDIEGEAVPMPNLSIGYLPQEPQLDAAQTVRE